MVQKPKCVEGLLALQMNIVSSSIRWNHTVVGRTGLRQLFESSSGESNGLHYVLDLLSDYGIIVGNGLQLSDDSQLMRSRVWKVRYQVKSLKAICLTYQSMHSSTGISIFGI